MLRQRPFAIIYFGGLSALTVLILAGVLGDLLPQSVAGTLARNSEAYVMVLVLSAWIALIRSRWTKWLTWSVTLVLTLVLVAISLLLLQVENSSLRTLNESTFALAILVAYVRLSRPLPVWAWALPAVAVALPMVFAGTTFATNGAESFGFLVLIPCTLDLVDRSILEPAQPERLGRVCGWVAFLILVPAVISLVRPDSPVGVMEEVLRYLSRPTEAFVSAVLLLLYFSLGRPEWVSWKDWKRHSPQRHDPDFAKDST